MNPKIRQWLYGLIIIGGLGTAGYVLFARGKDNVATNAENELMDGVCLACKTEAQLTVPREERAPYRCAKCNEQAVYPWWYCYDCKKRFIPALESTSEGPRRVPALPTCTNCQSSNVTAYIAAAQLEPPAGDVPLPSWP